MMDRRMRLALWLLFVSAFSLGPGPVHGQSSPSELGSLQKDMETVKNDLARIKKELGESPRVIATGGLAGLIAAETSVIKLVDQRLMLEGLRLIYDLNA